MSDKLLKGKGRIVTDPDEIRNSLVVNRDQPGKRTSDEYNLISTATLLDFFAQAGWNPDQMKMRKSRKEETAATGKHIIRLSHPDYKIDGQGNINIMALNAHDGTAALKMGYGFFKFICGNGLVAGKILGVSARILHKDVNADSVFEAIEGLLGMVNRYTDQISSWTGVQLSDSRATEFARQAALLRWPDAKLRDTGDLLKVHRIEDDNNSLWSIYNRVQENASLGNAYLLKQGKDEKGAEYVISRKARPLIGAEADYIFNESLSDLAEEFAQAA